MELDGSTREEVKVCLWTIKDLQDSITTNRAGEPVHQYEDACCQRGAKAGSDRGEDQEAEGAEHVLRLPSDDTSGGHQSPHQEAKVHVDHLLLRQTLQASHLVKHTIFDQLHLPKIKESTPRKEEASTSDAR